jgi:hypothetical protein
MTSPEAAESPFVTIWEAPRATVRRLVAVDPRRHVNALFFVSGVVTTLTALARSRDQFTLQPPAIALAALGYGVVNVPLGHLNAWYKRWVGGLLGGSASRQAVALVGAWSTVPVIAGHGALLAIQVALYGLEPFSDEHPTMDASASLVQLVFMLASVLFTVWSVLVSIAGFAEVNGFSLARSIATSVLAVVILAMAALVLAVVALLAIAPVFG